MNYPERIIRTLQTKPFRLTRLRPGVAEIEKLRFIPVRWAITGMTCLEK